MADKNLMASVMNRLLACLPTSLLPYYITTLLPQATKNGSLPDGRDPFWTKLQDSRLDSRLRRLGHRGFLILLILLILHAEMQETAISTRSEEMPHILPEVDRLHPTRLCFSGVKVTS